MKLPIIMTTYDRGGGERTAVAIEAIKALKENLLGVEPVFVICDDSSPNPGHIPALKEVLENNEAVFFDAERGGVGRSKNLGIQYCYDNNYSIFLLMEDDWVLSHPLNIQAYGQVLLESEDVGMIRLGYLGGLDMRAKFAAYLGHTFWDLYEGMYVYSGQVSLRHLRFYDKIGLHTVNIAPGSEELDMCYRYAQLNEEDKLKILFPADYGVTFQHGPFRTIGDYSTNSGR